MANKRKYVNLKEPRIGIQAYFSSQSASFNSSEGKKMNHCKDMDQELAPKTFDLMGCLQRLSNSPTVQTCRQERLGLDQYTVPVRRNSVTGSETVDSESGKIDSISHDILVTFDQSKLQEFTPRQTIGDGNCLYRAVSLHLYGSEEWHIYVRVLASLEIIENEDIYNAKFPTCLKTGLEDIAYEELVKCVVTLGSYAELIHMYAISSAIGEPIQSYCPSSEGDAFPHMYTKLIYGRGISDATHSISTSNIMTLMWTMTRVPTSRTEFRCNANHIILLTRQTSPSAAPHTSYLFCLLCNSEVVAANMDLGLTTEIPFVENINEVKNEQQSSLINQKTAEKEKKSIKGLKYDWLLKEGNGYMCTLCKNMGIVNKQGGGAWVNIPVIIETSRKLYKKADKHAQSSFHKLSFAAANNNKSTSGSVSEQMHFAANKRFSGDSNCLKSTFRAAYFLFSSEIAHTTNWRSFISTIAACDASRTLQNFFEKVPCNATHLSSTAVTDILESYGEAISQDIKQRVEKSREFSVMADECTNFNGQEMTSVCVRILTKGKVVEVFLGCWPPVSTKAADVHKCILESFDKFNLDPANVVAASFDGASNMSGQHAGVQALLRKHSPNLIFVHCRSHMLQLAMEKASSNNIHIKRVFGILNKLYSFFQHSALRLNVLKTVQMAIDGITHKLIQSCDTRWLSNEGSVRIILCHYPAILVALESIYVDAGNMSSDAGGLLLTLRKASTIFFLTLMHSILEPLSRLSKCFQTSEGNMSQVMSIAKAVTSSIADIDLDHIMNVADASKQKILDAGGSLQCGGDDLSIVEQKRLGEKLHRIYSEQSDN